MTIKHIVIPGGGSNFPILIGAIQQLNKEKFWQYKDIKTIHGTSCGSLVGLMILLQLNWDDLNDYLIERPWKGLFELTPEMLMSAYTNKGIIGLDHLKKAMEPIFKAKDINIDITFKELYELTKIEFYVYVTNFNDMILEIFNHKTKPDLSIMKAINMSAALPPVVSPVIMDNILYVDGGLLANNPIKQAIEYLEDDVSDEILGFEIQYQDNSYTNITEESNILEYMSQLLCKLADRSDPTSLRYGGPPKIKNRVVLTFESVVKTDTWINLVIDKEYRKKRIQAGVNYANIFLKYICL